MKIKFSHSTKAEMNSNDLYSKALDLSKQGQYSKAIKEFDKFISHNPHNADVFSDRGVAKYHVKDFEGSLKDFNTALELEPENPYRYASRAYIRDCSGDTEGAIATERRRAKVSEDKGQEADRLGEATCENTQSPNIF